MLETIRQFYPGALPGNSFVAEIYHVLETHYHLLPHQILLAHCICSDDVNSIEYPEEGRKMLGPFNLGGLDGFPFTGLTGMGAFASHVPEDGAALIFFAPHIGIGASGIPGEVLRIGQHKPTGCCGALVKAVKALKAGTVASGTPDTLDYQQQTLEQIISNSGSRILSAPNELIAGTDVVYEASEHFIDRLVQGTTFSGRYIFVIGAIIINSDRDYGSFLQLRKFQCLNAPNKTLLASHTFAELPVQ